MLHHVYQKCERADAETIVLIHGFGGDHRVWKKQIAWLQEQYHVLAIDLPSHSEGNIKLSQIPVTLDSIARQITQVMDHYGLKKCMFMGVSLGTVFVKYLEVFYPEYVSIGVLVGTMARVNILLRSITDLFSRIGDKLPFGAVYHLFSWIIMPGRRCTKSRSIFRDCAKALNEIEFKHYMKIFREAFRFNNLFKKLHHAENIYISGTRDRCFKNGARNEAASTFARFIWMHGSGHVCNIDKRQQFDAILSAILRQKAHLEEQAARMHIHLHLPHPHTAV